jgi:hypothetical protein
MTRAAHTQFIIMLVILAGAAIASYRTGHSLTGALMLGGLSAVAVLYICAVRTTRRIWAEHQAIIDELRAVDDEGPAP